MQKTWLRRLLKILFVYFIACAPDMWKLAMLGPPVYLYRMVLGEIAYLPALAPFAVIFAVGLIVVWVSERRSNPPRAG